MALMLAWGATEERATYVRRPQHKHR